MNERLNYKNFVWVLGNALPILRESKNWLKKLAKTTWEKEINGDKKEKIVNIIERRKKKQRL